MGRLSPLLGSLAAGLHASREVEFSVAGRWTLTAAESLTEPNVAWDLG